MQRRIVKDEQAVSPVIAVILMVAITVVLAAVLYVWASSFLGGTTKNAPTGSMIASEDGSGVWTVQIVKINPQVSVNSVHWYLLDVQGNTKTDGLVSDVYGYYSGQGKAVVFIDNDFNGELARQSLNFRGKSGLQRERCQVTPGRREPMESAAENIPL